MQWAKYSNLLIEQLSGLCAAVNAETVNASVIWIAIIGSHLQQHVRELRSACFGDEERENEKRSEWERGMDEMWIEKQ